MARSKETPKAVPAAKVVRGRARGLVGREIELIMRERERLLRAAGAAAALVTHIDVRDLPRDALGPVHQLGALLDALPEETLADALNSLHAMHGQPGRLGVAS